MANKAERSLPSRNTHPWVQLWSSTQSKLTHIHSSHIFSSCQFLQKGQVSKCNTLVFLAAPAFLLYFGELFCIWHLEHWHVESTICTSVGYRWKKGVAKHFLSYQYVSRCCLFLSKFRIIGKPHDKIAATFEHPDLQKYKLSIGNSLHSSIPIMFYWCLEILI